MEKRNPGMIIDLLLSQISSLSLELAMKEAEIIELRKTQSSTKEGEIHDKKD